ncbi:ECF transporter S component [Halobacillus salinarum]|uniref:ECF transporter S component n=1 Tax=Halobacillus salinarum TaxID=2932257 RepID=A0ABY4EDY2_9BACI|nr:ECF transporter S component [Halobacillus salinarum]UOQ42669.1 ECF transporter S component [Halobacillus salinarum]
MNTYKLTLIAMLSALAVAGRLVMANVPNVQPVTAIIILSGFWLGPISGIAMAVLTTLLSNVLLGMGYWTIWQITAWGMIGLIAGLLGKFFKDIPIWGLALYGFFSGLFYGFIISITMKAAGQPFWGYYLAGLPFDLNHAASNLVFILVLSPVLSRLFQQYRNKHAITRV